MRRLLLLFFVTTIVLTQSLPPNHICRLRCLAKCITSSKVSLPNCTNQCVPYDDQKLCSDQKCWSVCKDLGPTANLSMPTDVRSDKMNGASVLFWTPVPGATIYAIQFKLANAARFDGDDYTFVTSAQIKNFQNPKGTVCDSSNVMIMAVAENALSPFTTPKTVDAPSPNVNPALQIKSLVYIDQPFIRDGYDANGTLELTFAYTIQDWILGPTDLIVEPLFHMINCAEPDLSKAVPLPDFMQGAGTTIVGELGADMMYRQCRFMYYVQSIESKACGTRTFIHSPPPDAINTVVMGCDTVTNAPCKKAIRHEPPVCGQVDDVEYKVLNPNVKSSDKLLDLILNVTFTPVMRSNEPPTLYYVAFYGHASNYSSDDERVFLGVNMTSIDANTTNCENITQNGDCAYAPSNWVILNDIHMDILYGVTFCAVKDPMNLTFPDFLTESRALRPKADPIFVYSRDYAGKSPVGLIIGVVIGGLCLILVGTLAICIIINKRQKKRNEKFRLKITQLELEKESRYTDFPKKFDIWEIERRNLIIHNDKKLGSGAFGAVYLGKLLGKSLGHKDANSPLGVNLMRAENCDVAVKMLPEYADELSKSEFLREIGLMKTLGYHERLVNMLACITDSEPLCLIVEYCSDGDLLHFLRSRCKYMMKLDELGIDYHQPPVNENYDLSMIITLKQLLMFAVQISYGLEYLSQKGFVHRDVAARNILVHEMNSCKIGDFGLCRYVYSENSHYKSKGGRLPLKWMSPEAIRHYEFSTQSDVWSFGILLFEIITLGGSPYPGIQPEDMLAFLESNGRMDQPDNCPDDFYAIMKECWQTDPEIRPEFSHVRQKLAAQLEEVTEEYSYLKLDAQKDYYNVQYGEKADVIILPEDEDLIKIKKDKIIISNSLSSVESIPRDSIIFDPNDEIDRIKAEIKRQKDEEDTQSSLVTDSMSISMGAISDSNV